VKLAKPWVSLVVVGLFLLVYATHANSRIGVSSDSKWTLYTAKSLLTEGNFNLNEFDAELSDPRFYGVSYVDDYAYQFFPLAPAVLAVPFVYIYDRYPRLSYHIFLGVGERRASRLKAGFKDQSLRHRVQLERAIASFLVALTTITLFCFLKQFISLYSALFLALLFAFATPAWSTASRGLWQHGPSMLFLMLALYFLMLPKEQTRSSAIYSGIFVAVSYMVRPTNSISVLLMSVYMFMRRRAYFISFVLSLLILASGFIFFNLLIYKSILPPYFLPSRVGEHSQFWEAFWGNIASPSRGILVYSPVFLFSIVGFLIGIRKSDFRALSLLLGSCVVLHLMVISSFAHWWGGYSYGPRLFSDMSVYLVVLMLPLVHWIERTDWTRRFFVLVPFGILLIFSVFVHYRGANIPAVNRWNARPVSVDRSPERVWHWNDPQFLRGLQN